MKILFKYTTRSRRSNFLRGIDSIVNNLADKSNYHILISVENEFHDSSMHPLPQLDCVHTYKVNTDNPTSKVDAINRDLNEFTKMCDWDILVNMSDDMVFIEKGVDDIIRGNFVLNPREPLQKYGTSISTSDLDQCLHFPDQNQGKNCMTMSIMGRDYYNRDNFIYNPEFESLWVDIVAQEQAQIRGCYKYIDKHIFNHLHPSFGQGHYDEQYIATEDWGVRQRDYITYLKLKKEYDPTNIYQIRSI